MRRTRIALVVTALMLATTSVVRAQHSVGRMSAECGCGTCWQCGGTEACCPSLLTSITQGVHTCTGFACSAVPGLDARHDIYRAALHRNDFRQVQPLVPADLLLPQVRLWLGRDRLSALRTGGYAEGEEVIDMQQVPEGVSIEPTPATEPTPAVAPDMPPLPDQTVPSQGSSRATSVARAGSRGTLHDPDHLHETSAQQNLRVTAWHAANPAMKRPATCPADHGPPTAKPTSSIQRTSLLQVFQSSESANPLRE